MGVRQWFSTLEKAKKVANKRGKNVYKMTDGVYFVGTYSKAIDALRLVYRHKKKRRK